MLKECLFTHLVHEADMVAATINMLQFSPSDGTVSPSEEISVKPTASAVY